MWNPCLFNRNSDNGFLQIFITYNTLFRVSFFSDVIFNNTFILVLNCKQAEFLIKKFSPIICSKEVNKSLFKHTCLLVSVSIHYFFGLKLTRFNSKTMTEKFMFNTSWMMSSITFASCFLLFFIESLHSTYLSEHHPLQMESISNLFTP